MKPARHIHLMYFNSESVCNADETATIDVLIPEGMGHSKRFSSAATPDIKVAQRLQEGVSNAHGPSTDS